MSNKDKNEKAPKLSQVDIAIEAKVHRNTVYYYFRGLAVSKESKEAIEKAIEKLKNNN